MQAEDDDTSSTPHGQSPRRSIISSSKEVVTQPIDSQVRSSLIPRSFGEDFSVKAASATTTAVDRDPFVHHDAADAIHNTYSTDAIVQPSPLVNQESEDASSESSEATSDDVSDGEVRSQSQAQANSIAPPFTLDDDNVPSIPDDDDDPADVDALLKTIEKSSQSSDLESDIEDDFPLPGMDNDEEGDWV
jgi:hypothetical protein